MAYKDSCLRGDEPGLVGYWRFDENIDTVTYDLTGSGNHAMLRNGATWSTDVPFTAPCSAVGLAPISVQPRVSIYPNPVSDRGVLQMDGAISGSRVQVYDMLGRLHDAWLAEAYSVIRTTDYRPGVYMLMLASAEGRVQSIKFVVE